MSKHRLIGQKAPEFTLRNSDNEEFNFKPVSDDKRPTALFFYPQSGTYGCTKEACQFNSALNEDPVFKNTNVRVIGISPDSVTKQKKFVDKNRLTYPILSDEEGSARQKYSVTRGLMGLTTSSRVTFVIDDEGIVKDVLDTTLNFAAHHRFVQNWLETQVKQKKPESQPISGEGLSVSDDARSSSETRVNAEPANAADQTNVNGDLREPLASADVGAEPETPGTVNEAETNATTARSTDTAVDPVSTPSVAVTPAPTQTVS